MENHEAVVPLASNKKVSVSICGIKEDPGVAYTINSIDAEAFRKHVEKFMKEHPCFFKKAPRRE